MHLLRSRHLVGVGFLLSVCGDGTQVGSKDLEPLSHLIGLNASPFNAIALVRFQLRGPDIQYVARSYHYNIIKCPKSTRPGQAMARSFSLEEMVKG